MADKYPHWAGTYHLTQTGTEKRRKIIFKERVPLYDFQNDVDDPLTLHLGPDEWVRPFRHFDKFDFGSVPLALQGIVSPISAPKAFALHDSCYEFHGLWGPTGVQSITRSRADELLRIGMRAEKCSAWTAWKAWVAVRLGGGGIWGSDLLTDLNSERFISAAVRSWEEQNGIQA